jgi:hypothetical protein
LEARLGGRVEETENRKSWKGDKSTKWIKERKKVGER